MSATILLRPDRSRVRAARSRAGTGNTGTLPVAATQALQAKAALARLSPLAEHWVTRDVLVPFALTRVALAAVGLFSVLVLPRSPYVPREWGVPGAHPLLQAFTRWDWQWYTQIAGEGYSYGGGQSSTAFFPLYPILARAAAALFGGLDPVALALGGVLVANAALVVGLIHLVALVREEFDTDTASRAALYVLVFPSTLFLSAAYADSLFFALSVASFYHARQHRWWLAGALGGLAALSRPHGVLVVVPLALELVLQVRELRTPAAGSEAGPQGAGPRSLVGRGVLALGLVPAGFAVYAGFLWFRFGDPLAFVHSHEAWGRGLSAPWETLARFFSAPLTLHSGTHSLVDLAFAALLVGLAIASWRYLRASYALFETVFVIAVISTGILLSSPRYAATFFPGFIVLALAGREASFHRAYVIAASILALVFMAMFAQWYWVA